MKEIKGRQAGVERINEKLMSVLQQQSNQFQKERNLHTQEIEDIIMAEKDSNKFIKQSCLTKINSTSTSKKSKQATDGVA